MLLVVALVISTLPNTIFAGATTNTGQLTSGHTEKDG